MPFPISSVKLRSIFRFLWWKLGHPFEPFSSYYTHRVSDRLSAGESHGTLGPRIKDPVQYRESAEAYLQLYREHGLTPEDRVIDFGCGSLRIGSVLIPFLEPAHYVGLDTTDRFFSEGLRRIPKNLLSEKKPACYVIEEERISRLAGSFCPSFLVSTHVLIHVPRKEISAFFSKISTLLPDSGVALVDFMQSPEPHRFHELTWSYPLALIVAEASRQGFSAQPVEQTDSPALSRLKSLYGDDFTVVTLSRLPSPGATR